ncbi:hypothetical protein RB16p246 [Escherichia phage RB16]|uniref:Conserved hypothetical phage protein n=1 Tax=Escherichia phage RB16 TaxID=2681599 RepID=D9ICV7_BPRB1|nr:hypothetical protein RB16p246 [Escherichia phage RB16]ADJ55550.1 conserved hypothetical phage protein [Escherichia phage RB16]
MFPLKARIRNKTGTQEWMECLRETKHYYISQAVGYDGKNIRAKRTCWRSMIRRSHTPKLIKIW